MTIDEYKENHDIHEGAEEPCGVDRCPVCGSDECEVYALRDGEIVGCDEKEAKRLLNEGEWSIRRAVEIAKKA